MYGKLGHGTEIGHSTPKQVEAMNGISVAHVACGSRVRFCVFTLYMDHRVFAANSYFPLAHCGSEHIGSSLFVGR